MSKVAALRRVFSKCRNRLFPDAGVSSHYSNLQESVALAEGRRLCKAWQDNVLPQRQRVLVEHQLREYRSGVRVDVFDVFVSSLLGLPETVSDMSLLEIGCSSGYYSEVVRIAGLPVKYSGCDYSEAFISLAREKHPSVDFAVADATSLDYPDSSFDIVVSGCCLLHIVDYVRAIEETARVAGRYAVFHRTPVVWGQPEQWYRKQAYGIETVEIHFNESEFLATLQRNGLGLLATYTLSEEDLGAGRARGKATRTYVCRKTNQ